MVTKAKSTGLPLYERLFLRLSKGTIVDGIWIGACGNDAAAISRVQMALSLIQSHDRCRYDRIIRDLKKIWVAPLIGCAGNLDIPNMICRIDSTYAVDLSLEYLASVIVHEATHARIAKRAIPYSEDLRCRIERLCMRQELAFAKTLPDNAVVMASIAQRLQAAPDTWSNQAMIGRYNANAYQRARDAGLPDWATRAFMRIGRIVNAGRRS